MKKRLLWPALSLVLVIAAPARTALAQEASRAQALFDDGRRLMNEGKLAEACPKLAASQKLDPGAGTLMNLATCYDKNGQLASAWATYKEAAAASRSSGHPDWEAAARGRADKIEPDLARLVVAVPKESRVAGLVVERDGAPIDAAEFSTPMPIDSGVHTIRASAPGKKAWSTQITIGGARTQASVAVPVLESEGAAPAVPPPGAARPAETPAPGPAKDEGNTQRLLGLVAGGVGIVGLGAGTIFGLKAKSTYNDAVGACNADHQCPQGSLDKADDASSQATISTISFIAGGVLLAGGAVLYLTAPRAAPDQRGSAGNMHVSLGGPGLAGMTLGGAF
jgi:hypothetical protein